jgi:hypothetical protein
MGIIRSIRRFLAKLVGSRIKEDILSDFDSDDEPSHHLYRQLGVGRGFRAAARDLRPVLQDEQNRQAYKFYIENPFIRRLARMTAEFIVGNGISVKSGNPAVQEELDAWWNDPVNDWERRHFTLAVEYPLYGEAVLERVANVFTGRHRYNWLDPLFIAQVHPHPKFPGVPAAIDFWNAGAGGGRVVTAAILNGVPEAAMLGDARKDDESPKVFYFRTNQLSGALRGHSNYYPLFEWADVLDNAAFTMGERMVILLTYVWHLKAKNLDPETKKNYRKKLEEANPGAALISDTETTLEAIAPDLKSADFTEGARFLRNLIAGSAGIPEHWLGEGGDVNRATAVAMNLPTIRSFVQQQREYVAVIRSLARANLESVARMGRIPASEIDDFTVQVDPMNPADSSTVANALGTLVGALTSAKLEGWVTDREAAQAVRNILGGIVELDEEAPPPGDLKRAELPPATQAAVERIRRAMDGEEEPAHDPGNGAVRAP